MASGDVTLLETIVALHSAERQGRSRGGGAVMWSVGLSMGVARFLGALMGDGHALRLELTRPLLVFTCLALAAKLLLG